MVASALGSEACLPKHWAVLIGIDYYSPDGIPNLHGCVQDVDDIEKWLQSNLPLQSGQIIKLSARRNDDGNSQMPTYDNVMAAFEAVKREAASGDFVYIHYSGHGARVPAKNPEIKSATQMDEVLVLRGNRPLRDFELGGILDDLALRGLTVFVVLDCCHSGGVERDAVSVRGVDYIPLLEEALPPANASPPALTESYDAEKGGLGVTRDATVQDCWWTKARDYTVLAACQPHEKAREMRRKGRSNGVLTYSMLESFNVFAKAGRPINYAMLYNDVRARMYAEYNKTFKDLEVEFRPQHPMILGRQERALFSSEVFGGSQLSSVIQVEECRVYIDIGEPHGVACGDRFAIYDRRSPFSLTSTPGKPLCEFTVDSVSGAQASGIMPEKHPLVAPGSWVKLVASATRHDVVAVIVESSDLLQDLLLQHKDSDPQNAILGLFPWHQTPSPAYEVHVHGDCYEITFGSGQPISNISPIPVAGEGTAERIYKILLTLAKYRIVKSLSNNMSYLDGLFGFKVSVGKKLVTSGTVCVCENETVTLQFQNYSEQTLYYTILNLTPSWAIKQLRPRPGDEPTGIQPGKPGMPLRVTMEMPKGQSNMTEIEDLIKVIVTTEPTQFWMLQSPGLAISSAGEWRGGDEIGPGHNGLYRILKQLGASRNARPQENWDDWQTYELVIRTRKRDDSPKHGESSPSHDLSPEFVANIMHYVEHKKSLPGQAGA